MRRILGFVLAAFALAFLMAALAPHWVVNAGRGLVEPLVVTLDAATPCENLASLTLPDTTITLAQTVAAGAFTPPPAPARGRAAAPPAAAPAGAPPADAPAPAPQARG